MPSNPRELLKCSNDDGSGSKSMGQGESTKKRRSTFSLDSIDLVRDDAAHGPTTKIVRALGLSTLHLSKGLS